MSNVKQHAATVLKIVGRAAGAGIRSFLLSTLALGGLAVVLLGGSLAVTRAAGGWAMLSAALLTVALGAVAWWIVASKRALAAALAGAVQQSELGRHTMELVFDRLLHVEAEDTHGERGRRPAEVTERLPLQQAEARLTAVVDRLLAERADKRGPRAWLARRMRAASLRLVQRVTLEELRDEDAQHGGVDLVQARDKLAQKVDKKLVNLIRNSSRKLTRLLVFAFVVLSLGGGLGIRYLFHS